MLVLGIETTCDETSVALVRDGHAIVGQIIISQELHERYGGVVPELACRRHIEVLDDLVSELLSKHSLVLKDIDLIAVARGPGLIGALLIGLTYAKGLSLATGIPFIGVNHVEGHLYAALMGRKALFPALGVVLSGGHSHLLWMESLHETALIGRTVDDAMGEAFDKVAALLDLPYPGGPAIESLAKNGDPKCFPFKPGNVKGRPFDLSFSGLKTAVLYAAKGQNAHKKSALEISDQKKAAIAASFQRAAFQSVSQKIKRLLKEIQPSSMVFGGGVLCNQALRAHLEAEFSLPLFFPPKGMAQDNAAMIAGLGFMDFQKKGPSHATLPALPRIPLPPPLPFDLMSKKRASKSALFTASSKSQK